MNRFELIWICRGKHRVLSIFNYNSKVNQTTDVKVEGQEDGRTDFICVLAKRHQDNSEKTVKCKNHHAPVKYYNTNITSPNTTCMSNWACLN